MSTRTPKFENDGFISDSSKSDELFTGEDMVGSDYGAIPFFNIIIYIFSLIH
jgi:hypothetical protein